MPITTYPGNKNYVLGRGRIFFDRYANGATITAATLGEGERYFGNTPTFATSSTSENLDHYDSDSGIRVKDDSVPLSFDRSGSLTVDNISPENVALYFLATGVNKVTQAAATAQVDADRVMNRGRYYQAGVSAAMPAGVRNIKTVIVSKVVAGTPTAVTMPGNYEVDEVRGRILIEPNAPGIADGDLIRLTYDVEASTRDQIISKNDAIYGALRYVADNPKGENKDFYFPYVKLTPDGDYAFKGDEWQVMTFAIEILKKASNIEAAYIDGQPVPVTP